MGKIKLVGSVNISCSTWMLFGVSSYQHLPRVAGDYSLEINPDRTTEVVEVVVVLYKFENCKIQKERHIVPTL